MTFDQTRRDLIALTVRYGARTPVGYHAFSLAAGRLLIISNLRSPPLTRSQEKPMFGSKRIAELESNEGYLRRRAEGAEAIVAKKQADDYENRTWIEQGAGTNIKTLAISGRQLLRLEDGRTFFLPNLTNYYGSNGGYATPAVME